MTNVRGGIKVIFTRHDKKAARKLFNEGHTISLMTDDRNPVNSLTSEIDYTKGAELFYDSTNIACDFGQVLQDFAEWLDNDGYGHMPDRARARHEKFSYWTCSAAPASVGV